MREYWGLKEIATRMGWANVKTPIAKLKNEGFPMFRRRRGSRPGLYWYSNSELVARWELARVELELKRLRQQDAERAAARQAQATPHIED